MLENSPSACFNQQLHFSDTLHQTKELHFLLFGSHLSFFYTFDPSEIRKGNESKISDLVF